MLPNNEPTTFRHHSIRLSSRSASLSFNNNPNIDRIRTNLTEIDKHPNWINHDSISGSNKSENALLPINKSVNENGLPSRTKVIGTVTFYLVAAIIMVFSNKWVLNATSIPLTFLFFQLIIAIILLQIFSLTGKLKIPTFKFSIAYNLIPLITINILGLIFNTICLQFVDASFYQVARGLILPFTVIISKFSLNSKISNNIILSVILICLGFYCGIKSENFHSTDNLGILLGILSSLMTAIHSIIIKKSLEITKSTIELTFYNNLLSSIFLIPLIFITNEPIKFLQLIQLGGNPLKTFLIGTIITGIFGFLICLAGFISIKVTSPVTHMISSSIRGVIQTFLGIFLFNEIVTINRWIGICFILLGSGLYTFSKDQEQRQVIKNPIYLDEKLSLENLNHPQQLSITNLRNFKNDSISDSNFSRNPIQDDERNDRLDNQEVVLTIKSIS
ncbi:hypothetical protein CROQUDRAFT_50931 [Cronartium quercuum f. sp. fusiforme G11]|uniref:Sugar phosphate transporter domain-containing protein n=1 Tax=Cronartium quercuum f. sp. fusiforme G11 TaxID=708437 RepID=A0A9P6N8P1_9BASI|nr:hypothetical protein CROQUDRAFT_50931 [Cronartium quercuum f. sp. fusiforme G11]